MLPPIHVRLIKINKIRHWSVTGIPRCDGWLHRQIGASENMICATLQELTGEDASLFKNRIQMLEGFGDGKRIEVTPALFAILQNAAQVMACDLHRQRIGDDVSGLLLMLGPRGNEPERSRPGAR